VTVRFSIKVIVLLEASKRFYRFALEDE